MRSDVRTLLRTLTARGVLWHKRRGGRTWRKVGTFPTVADAAGEGLRREKSGLIGDWSALAEVAHPDDPKHDEE
jgi:hypothetical protein